MLFCTSLLAYVGAGEQLVYCNARLSPAVRQTAAYIVIQQLPSSSTACTATFKIYIQ